MKIISTNKQLREHLLRLIKKYPKMAFATAWASASTDVFQRIRNVSIDLKHLS